MYSSRPFVDYFCHCKSPRFNYSYAVNHFLIMDVMKQGNIAVPSLFLYEPRLLMRMLVASRVETDFPSLDVHPLLSPQIESLNGTFPGNKVLLFGVGGAGHSLYELLRAVRKMKSFKVKPSAGSPQGIPGYSA